MQKTTQISALLALWVALPPASALADPVVEERAEKPSPVTLGLAVGGSRYDNDYQSYYQATLVPSVALSIGDGVVLEGAMPVTGGFTPNSSCCRRGLGNATVGARYRLVLDEGLTLTIPGSLSLPTSSSEGEARRNGLYTATAELSRGAGLYLPDTTTARMAAQGQYRRGPFLAMLAVGTTVWSTAADGGRTNTVVFPVRAEVGWQAWSSLIPSLGLRTLTNPDADSPVVATAEVGASYQHGSALYRLTLSVPLDAESRERNLVSILGALSWKI
jgi:hypothetical protein